MTDHTRKQHAEGSRSEHRAEHAHRSRDAHQTHHGPQAGPVAVQEKPAQAAPLSVQTGLASSLLGDPRLNGRGNAPVKIALVQQMQQTQSGNRSLQRYLQRMSAQPASPTATIQRCGPAPCNCPPEKKAAAEAAQDVAVQTMPAVMSIAPLSVVSRTANEQPSTVSGATLDRHVDGPSGSRDNPSSPRSENSPSSHVQASRLTVVQPMSNAVPVQRGFDPLGAAKRLAEKIKGVIQGLGSQASSTAQGEGNVAVSGTQAQGNTTVNNARTQGQTAVTNAQTQGRTAVTNAQTQGRAAVNNAQSRGRAEVSSAQSRGRGAVTNAQSRGRAAVSGAQSRGRAAVASARSRGAAATSSVKGTANSTATAAKAQANGASKAFQSAGNKSAAQSKAASNNAFKTVQGLGQKAVSTASGLIDKARSGGLCAVIGEVVGKGVQLVKKGLEIAKDGVKKYGGKALNFAKNIGGKIKSGLKSVVSKISGGVKKAVTKVLGTAKKVGGALVSGVAKASKAVVSGVKNAAKAMANGVKSAAKAVWSGVKGTAKAMWSGVKGAAKAVWSGVKSTAKAMWSGVKSAATSVASAAKATAGALIGVADRLTGGLASKVGGMAGQILGKAAGIVRPFVIGLANSLANGAKNIANSLISKAKSTAAKLKAKAIETVEKLKMKAIETAQKLKDKATQAITKLKDKAVQTAAKLKDKAVQTVTKLKNKAVSVAGQLKAKAIGAAQGLAKAASGVAKAVKGKVSQLASAAGRKIGSAAKKVMGAAGRFAGKVSKGIAAFAKKTGIDKAAKVVASGAKKAWGHIKQAGSAIKSRLKGAVEAAKHVGEVVLGPTKMACKALGCVAPSMLKNIGSNTQKVVDVATDYAPIASTVKDGCACAIGKNVVTGDEMDNIDRTLSCVFAGVDIVSYLAAIPTGGASVGVSVALRAMFKAVLKSGGKALIKWAIEGGIKELVQKLLKSGPEMIKKFMELAKDPHKAFEWLKNTSKGADEAAETAAKGGKVPTTPGPKGERPIGKPKDVDKPRDLPEGKNKPKNGDAPKPGVTIKKQKSVVDPATGETHEIKVLSNGKIVRCSDPPCMEIAHSIKDRLTDISKDISDKGMLAPQAEALIKRADELGAQQDRIKALTGKARDKAETKWLNDASKLENEVYSFNMRRRASGNFIEPPPDKTGKMTPGKLQEMKVRERLRGEYEQPFGVEDNEIRSALGITGKTADILGHNPDTGKWLVAESKGGAMEHALHQFENTTAGLVRKHPEAKGNVEFKIFTNPEQMKRLNTPKGLANMKLKDGQLGFLDDAGEWAPLKVKGFEEAPVIVVEAGS